MTIKYRKLDVNGDYTFGQGSQDFYTGVQAVAQAILTRLQLYKDSFWRDLSDGVPMFQQILGTPGSAANVAAIDSILQSRINGTQDTVGITDFSSSFDPDARKYTFEATVQTAYSVTKIEGVI